MVRFPALYRRLAELTQRRLTPRSRLRRALLRRQIVSGWSAYNRQDFELMLVRYAPEVEFEFPPGQQTLGLSGTFRGHEAMAAGLREQAGTWASAQVEPAYLLDLGDRVSRAFSAPGVLPPGCAGAATRVDRERSYLDPRILL
jgi:hypothetical protein